MTIQQLVLLLSLLISSSLGFVASPYQPKSSAAFGLQAASLALPTQAPDNAIIQIQPNAMTRLRELRIKQGFNTLMLRVRVRNGACTGGRMSYVMYFASEDAVIDEDEDLVAEYPGESIKCVIDAKSALFLFGLELDYTDFFLIGDGHRVSYSLCSAFTEWRETSLSSP